MAKRDDEQYLTEQIITYLGNKRALLDFIEVAVKEVQSALGKDKLDIVDIFSGSGVVARLMKKYARRLYVNDLESYSKTINTCYLTNKNDVDTKMLLNYYNTIKYQLDNYPLREGFISRMYSPADDTNIQEGERVFFTHRNAKYIDTARQLLEEVPEPYKTYLLGPLLYDASVHNNTSGVFKGFYKNSTTGIGQFGGDGRNALTRILGDIQLRLPILSRYECESIVYQQDSNELAKSLPPVDLVYIDPPYNQHPYGSNYFMLNLINDYVEPTEISRVSGIPKKWNKSAYNVKKTAKSSMHDLCKSLKSKYLLISFNSEGFITQDEMLDMLSTLGEVQVYDTEYNTFRGCRNLRKRDIHVKEFLYLLRKYD